MRLCFCSVMVGLVILLLSGSDGVAADAEPVSQPAEIAEQDWTEFDDDFGDEEELEVWDPIEPFNRGMFWFNDKLYVYLFKPVARGYRFVVPELAREGVNNVFTNLGGPVRVLNAFLQGKVTKGLDELTIFVGNSTLGVGGLFDLNAGNEKITSEDFGQTLGHYGSGPGFYLVLPIFGPSNLRDGVGMFADRFVEPIPSPFYLKMKREEIWALSAFEKINWLSLDKDTYESIKRDSLDPYLFIRNAYMQKRAAEVDK